jgi:hypothetical protein
MFIDIVANRGSPPAILLRESIREGKRVRKRTIANLSALPIAQAEMIRRVRRIRHRLEGRVKAHILLNMLAYYVQWHMMQVWAPLTFMDQADADEARERDPVAAAQRSKAALDKVTSRRLPDGTPAMSFTRLLGHMATIVRNTVRSASARIGEATFTLTARPNPKQQHALDHLATITV